MKKIPASRTTHIAMLAIAICLCGGCNTLPKIPFKRQSATSAAVLDSQLSLARLAERRSNFIRAKQIYEKVAKQAPDNAIAKHRLGVILAQEGDIAEALASLRAAQKIAPSADILADIGYAHFLNGDLEQADNVLQTALASSPYNKRVVNNLALVAGHNKDYANSLALFRRANGAAKAHANLAYVMTQNGELNKAADEYHRALDYDKDLKLAANALVQIQDQLGHSPNEDWADTSQPRSSSQLASYALPPDKLSDAARIPSITSQPKTTNMISAFPATTMVEQTKPKIKSIEKPAPTTKRQTLKKPRPANAAANAIATSKARVRSIKPAIVDSSKPQSKPIPTKSKSTQLAKSTQTPTQSKTLPTPTVASSPHVTNHGTTPQKALARSNPPPKMKMPAYTLPDAGFSTDAIATIKDRLADSRAITPRPAGDPKTSVMTPPKFEVAEVPKWDAKTTSLSTPTKPIPRQPPPLTPKQSQSAPTRHIASALNARTSVDASAFEMPKLEIPEFDDTDVSDREAAANIEIEKNAAESAETKILASKPAHNVGTTKLVNAPTSTKETKGDSELVQVGPYSTDTRFQPAMTRVKTPLKAPPSKPIVQSKTASKQPVADTDFIVPTWTPDKDASDKSSPTRAADERKSGNSDQDGSNLVQEGPYT